MPNPWIILIALAIAAAAWGHGYWRGWEACAAAHNAEIIESQEEAKKLDAERREVMRERDDLARQLEEGAYADPVTVDRCLSPDRVRRLNSLR
ncbi:hypothetical protein [Roseovarius pacificus]|uniref:hypothetical protein n=1 Tax=Roseovarius pacificus TaxID=337701 RepID=UPI002A18E52A|nr:hypothetical protein [Roseovarius pacificus]